MLLFLDMDKKRLGINYFVKNALGVFRAILILVAIYFLVTVTLSFIPFNSQLQDCQPDREIYVSTNGIHADIIIPVNYFKAEFFDRVQLLPGTQFIAFGWGDRNFYIKTPEWKDLTFSVAFKALFLKSETAMHLTFYPRKGNNWKPQRLCDQQLRTLIVYIINTFRYDENDQFIKMDFDGYNAYDVFYEAEGSFTLFNTCNVWVNRGFKKSGIKTAVWTPFDFGVLHHVN